jgi:hypothetical protein
MIKIGCNHTCRDCCQTPEAKLHRSQNAGLAQTLRSLRFLRVKRKILRLLRERSAAARRQGCNASLRANQGAKVLNAARRTCRLRGEAECYPEFDDDTPPSDRDERPESDLLIETDQARALLSPCYPRSHVDHQHLVIAIGASLFSHQGKPPAAIPEARRHPRFPPK